MSGQPLKSSPLNELCSALPSLPARLQQVGRFVAANDYDATTRSMRDLATVAGADPAAFTRLAKAIGYSGWDELRAALTEARRPESSPFRRATAAGPTEISLVSKTRSRGGGTEPHLVRFGRERGEGTAHGAAGLIAG
jgi:DNA-binding MurR/RpiR family transcriptional regulator